MLGLWLELEDLVSTLGGCRAFCKTLLSEMSSFVHPPIHIHTLPFFILPPHTVLEHAMESLVWAGGSHSMQWEHQTMKSKTKQNKTLVPRALGRGR